MKQTNFLCHAKFFRDGAGCLKPFSLNGGYDNSKISNNSMYLFSFVEAPRKFITAELSIGKLASSSVSIIIY